MIAQSRQVAPSASRFECTAHPSGIAEPRKTMPCCLPWKCLQEPVLAMVVPWDFLAFLKGSGYSELSFVKLLLLYHLESLPVPLFILQSVYSNSLVKGSCLK